MDKRELWAWSSDDKERYYVKLVKLLSLDQDHEESYNINTSFIKKRDTYFDLVFWSLINYLFYIIVI